MRFGLGPNRPIRQPNRKWYFIDFETSPLYTLPTLTPAVWRTGLLGAAIMPRSFFIFHDHRTPRFAIVLELDFPASVSGYSQAKNRSVKKITAADKFGPNASGRAIPGGRQTIESLECQRRKSSNCQAPASPAWTSARAQTSPFGRLLDQREFPAIDPFCILQGCRSDEPDVTGQAGIEVNSCLQVVLDGHPV